MAGRTGGSPGNWRSTEDGRQVSAVARSKPAILTLGSEVIRPKPGHFDRRVWPPSSCLPWCRRLSGGGGRVKCQRIYQDFVGEHGFSGASRRVKRFVRAFADQPIPSCGWKWNGEWKRRWILAGRGVMVEGKTQAAAFFRIVFEPFAQGYSEAVWRQTTESLSCWKMRSAILAGFPDAGDRQLRAA